MTQITAIELHRVAAAALAGQGFPEPDAKEISAEFVVAELRGIRTHGVGKLASLNFGDLNASPTIVGQGPILRVNGNGGNGFLTMRQVAQRLREVGRQYGIGIAAVRNFSRYSSLYPYTDLLARDGFIGILMNTAGPAAVTPFGSLDPITGTNPVSFSFPTTGGVQTFDFATAEVVWGEIRQAALEGRSVKFGAFLDSAGDITTDPADVNAVRAFGGPKGWAINLAIEILAGPLVGALAGLRVNSEFDGGALLLALLPSALGADEDFTDQVSSLFADIRSSRPSADIHAVRIPGDSGRSRTDLADEAVTELSIPDTTISLLKRMSNGESISEFSSNPLFN